MKNRKLIKDEIIRRLSKEKAINVLCISGPWGSGKTYLWNEVKESFPNSLYISLFGCRDSLELRKRVLTAYLFKDGKAPGKDGVLKLFKESGVNSIFEMGKTLFKGADSYFGTNILSLNTDILNILPSDSVICFDDIERTLVAFSIEEILGVIDFLSVQKKAKIVILLNEDGLENERKIVFKKYLEKVSQSTLRVEADIASVYEVFTSHNQHKVWYQNHKDLVLNLFFNSNHQNLRTLLKVLNCLDQIHDAKVTIDDSHVYAVVFYLIEQASGLLKNKEDYNFLGGSLTLGWGDDGSDEGRREFLSKYFIDFADYRYSEALYDFVEKSYCDFSVLKNEIQPTLENLSEAEEFTRTIASYDWYNISQQEATELESSILEIFTTTHAGYTARQLFTLIIYFGYLLKMQGREVSEVQKANVIKIFADKAAMGDDSLNRDTKTYYMHFKDFFLPFWEAYNEKGLEHLAKTTRTELLEDIATQNAYAFAKRIHNKPIALKVAIDETFDALRATQKINVKFFHLCLTNLVEQLNSYHKDEVSSIDHYRKVVIEIVDDLINEENDVFELKRLGQLKQKMKLPDS